MYKITVKTSQAKIAKAFSEIHIKMWTNQTPLQITYPEYSIELGIGRVLNVLGLKSELEALNLKSGGDYVVSKILPVTNDDIEFSFKRKQEKINNSRIKRAIKRAIERGENINEKEYRKNMMRKTLNLPFLSIKSNSNGNFFKLFIEKVEFIEVEPDYYGMIK